MKTDNSVIAFGALMSGDVLLFELMLSSAKVDPNAVSDSLGPSLLVYAVAYRRPQCVKLLLNMQVDTEAKVACNALGPYGGLTALHAAVLPSFDTRVNKVADEKSPLALLCVRLLIEAGANANAVTEWGGDVGPECSVVVLCAKG